MILYFYLEVDFEWLEAWIDIIERKFLLVGLITWLLLFLLAITSPKIAIRRLGRNWRRIHRLTYIIAILSAVHFLMTGKVGDIAPLVYSFIVFVLLGERFIFNVFFQNTLPADNGMEVIRDKNKKRG